VADSNGLSDAEPTAIKFLVGSRSHSRWSYAWRIGSRSTSFYIKPLPDALQDIKISLHGPDPRHPEPGYKFALDASAAGQVERAGGALIHKTNWPDAQWFPGYRVRPGVDLVLRIRFPWDLFDSQASRLPPPPSPRRRDFAALIPIPQPGRAVDVDVFVCHEAPFWPNEAQARRDAAYLGPLTNTAGQHLTAVTVHRWIDAEPSPVVEHAVSGQLNAPPIFDRLRGLGAAFDPRGFAWVQEMWLARSRMRPAGFTAFEAPVKAAATDTT
jgi:hypothetical protein